ncbi:hypothetical protein AVEN_116578-1 [Araneus ventricosus]|uniref:HTH psq-type domain-containing protein n=1 Tax=Araneus ventricosus TaxID=182803 RepID=A0A4Y2HQD5_ARAVE|nr:hypothetical protein AVEN_116578-1 [Araneus ventricosus]
MVRTYKRKKDQSPPKRIDIEKAVNAEGLSVRKAAALYNVKLSALQDMLQEHAVKKVFRRLNLLVVTLVPVCQTEKIQTDVRFLSTYLGGRPKILKRLVLEIYAKNKNLSLRQPEKCIQARASGFNKVVVDQFLENLLELYSKYEFPPESIWNTDETGILNVMNPPKVIAEKGRKKVRQTVSAERGEYATMLSFINATGSQVPPVFVFPKVKFLDKMLKNGISGA